jgi:hypothetical protein
MGTLKYRQAHRKELVEKARIYVQTHKAQVAEYQAKYRAAHKEKTRLYNKQYRENNREEHNKRNAEWRRNHPESKIHNRELRKKWNKTEKGKLNQHRKNTRRKAYRKKYGSTILNQPFPESAGHHIDKETVIYIPQEIHTPIKHNLRTGENMTLINKLAIDWLNQWKNNHKNSHYPTKTYSI